MANGMQATCELQPLWHCVLSRSFNSLGNQGNPLLLWAIHCTERILMQQVFHIRQDQFLVLLLVIQAQLNRLKSLWPIGWITAVNEFLHVCIDVRAIGIHFCDRWAGDQATLRAGLPRPKGFIVGIEQVKKLRVIGRQFWPKLMQNHSFKKPAGVPQVPLGGACVSHGLHALVFI